MRHKGHQPYRGLVRECVHQLPQFGFRLEKCDQGVMYETLQTQSIPKSRLRPGDLIFYAGEYRDPEKAPKRHQMVHIEIYLGPGDRSIGSRSACWQYIDKGLKKETSELSGVQLSGVQVYQSYLCVSRKWFPPQVTYCSLDKWLEGQCQLPQDFIEKRKGKLLSCTCYNDMLPV